LAWLIAGRPWGARALSGVRNSRARPGAGTSVPHQGPRATATNPDDDEEFLASLRLRVEEQRRRAREAAEREHREDDLGL
jgi:hypothetical protein